MSEYLLNDLIETFAPMTSLLNTFKTFFFFLLILEEGGREKHECERETWSVASLTCPDWGSNPPPFGAWNDTPTS